MREAIRVTCMLVIAAAIFVAAMAWINDRPTAETWIWRVASTGIGLVALVLFLVVHFQRDAAPDYLFERVGTFFESNGFCFMAKAISHQGTCYLEVYFQNQQNVPSQGTISLRPALGFFLTRAGIESIRVEISCAPGAFGVARLAIPVQPEFQGTQQSFEVGASVVYPDGKGSTIRFRDGIVVRKNADLFNAVGTALTIGGALTGQLILTKPDALTLALPTNVRTEIPAAAKPQVITLWKLGDAPLKA